MIGKLFGKEEVNAALVLALSGAVMALVARGSGPLTLGRVVSGVLSNPVPRRVAAMSGDGSAPVRDRRIAA